MRLATKRKSLCSILILIVMLAGCSNVKPPAPASERLEATIAQETTVSTEQEETTVPTTVLIERIIVTEPKTESVEAQSPATEPPTTTPPATVSAETVPPATEPPTATPPVTEVPTAPPKTETTTATIPPTELTEPAKETIDTVSIETSTNAYAASLGYIIDTSLQKGNCGYYPPDYRPLSRTEEGIKAAKELVDATTAQLNSRFTTEHSDILVEEAYGYARASCRVEFSHTDELGDWYLIYIYYG